MHKTHMSWIVFALAAVLAFGGFTGNTQNLLAQNVTNQTIYVGVVVSDLEESMEFYENVIGMKNTRDFDVGEDFADISGLSNGVPFHVEVMQLGTKENATEWKLMEFTGKAKTQKDKFIYGHTGMQYITINVDNLTPYHERIKEHNVKLLGETPVPLGEENHFILVQDPDGVFIELIGPMK